MLQPGTSTPAPAAAPGEAVVNDADAAGQPPNQDASQDVVQVATVDSFQVTCHTGNRPVTCCKKLLCDLYRNFDSAMSEHDTLQDCPPLLQLDWLITGSVM